MSSDSCKKVLQIEFLRGEIIQRSRGSKVFLQASHVSTTWRQTARIPSVIHGFHIRNTMCFVGFMLEHARVVAPDTSLITPGSPSDDDPARELRERFVADGLYGKDVLGTFNGQVICRIVHDNKEKLFICCPYSQTPRLFKKVGPSIPAMDKIPEDSTYGLFAVLEPTDGPVSGYPVVFVKDNSTDYRSNHLGVYFDPVGRIRVHVLVLKKGAWIPYASDPIILASEHIMFQRAPYCVQAGHKIYLMYLVGIIVCFDVLEGKFTNVPLPDLMRTSVKGCLQYTAGPHLEGDLAIINLERGRVAKWVLSRNGNNLEWHLDGKIDLIAALGDHMSEHILRAYSFELSEWCSFQVRSVSPDGRYLLLSVAVIHGLFVIDMLYRSSARAPDLHKLGRVFPLNVYWPSKP